MFLDLVFPLRRRNYRRPPPLLPEDVVRVLTPDERLLPTLLRLNDVLLRLLLKEDLLLLNDDRVAEDRFVEELLLVVVEKSLAGELPLRTDDVPVRTPLYAEPDLRTLSPSSLVYPLLSFASADERRTVLLTPEAFVRVDVSSLRVASEDALTLVPEVRRVSPEFTRVASELVRR